MSKKEILEERRLSFLTNISGLAIQLNYDLHELSDEEFCELLAMYNDAFTKILDKKISDSIQISG